jgi:broad specificity phosphatase PhoE
MTTRIFLISHASTASMRTGAFPLDDPLDALGLAAASGLRGRLPVADRVWTSPALRARQTAGALGLEAAVEPALRDWDYGRWAGRSLAEIRTESPARLGRWLADPSTAPPAGESGSALLARVGGWLEDKVRSGGQILAITHVAVVRAAIVHVLGAPPRSFAHLDIGPLTLTRLTCHAGHWRLRDCGVDLAGRRRVSSSCGADPDL